VATAQLYIKTSHYSAKYLCQYLSTLAYKYLQSYLSISTKYKFSKVLKYEYVSTQIVLKYVLKYFGT